MAGFSNRHTKIPHHTNRFPHLCTYLMQECVYSIPMHLVTTLPRNRNFFSARMPPYVYLTEELAELNVQYIVCIHY